MAKDLSDRAKVVKIRQIWSHWLGVIKKKVFDLSFVQSQQYRDQKEKNNFVLCKSSAPNNKCQVSLKPHQGPDPIEKNYNIYLCFAHFKDSFGQTILDKQQECFDESNSNMTWRYSM